MNSRPPLDLTDSVKVLLFKDNKVARSLVLPLKWIPLLGLTVLALTLITAASLTWAIKITYRIKSLHPERVQELEDKILALEGEIRKSGILVAQSQPSPAPAYTSPATPLVLAIATPTLDTPSVQPQPSKIPSPVAGAPAGVNAAAGVIATVPAPSPTPTSVSINMPANTAEIQNAASVFFDLVPELKSKTTPDRASLAIEIDEPKARIKDRKLEVDFNIHYVGQDGSSQRGVILMIAKGPKFFDAYPERLIRATTPQLQIGLAKGEWFLVSRFRAVHGEFANISSLDGITQIEILLLDGDLNPLLYEKITP